MSDPAPAPSQGTSTPRRYPRVRTERHARFHPKIVAQFAPDEPEREFCGDSWCKGDCGLPAGVLVMPDGSELKMFSDMTAMGPVMQRFRNEWRGSKFVIRDEFREDLMEWGWQ